MEYLFDRELRYKDEDQYKSLYKWAITEHDTEGKQIGRDLIPWLWSAYFTAMACDFNDIIEEDRYAADDGTDVGLNQSRVIRIKLRSGYNGYGESVRDQTSFSMLGTGRYIKDITLEIRSLDNPNGTENCTAWGIVSYTSEHDFREIMTDDCMGFRVHVKPERFERYAEYIREKSVDIINFSVSRADGFYSDWSPSISTSHIKILVPENQSEVINSDNSKGALPVLGKVSGFRLWFGSRLILEKSDIQEKQEIRPTDHIIKKQALTVDDKNDDKATNSSPIINQIELNLAPIKKVLWIAATLLLMIFVRLLMMG